MDKLLLVDGHNLLFQMFYGMPARIINEDGKAIQGTLGFIGTLLKIIRMIRPDYLTVLFDSERENSRMELDAQYKANRTDYSHVSEEENPFSQLADVYAALDFMGIRHAEAATLEADDIIASYALAYGRGLEIVIASWDSDFFQLIDDHVSVLRYRGVKTLLCDRAYIQQKYGVTPEQYADFKALTGDAADNIKGADQIGPKNAARLLSEFRTLDNILANAGQIAKPSIRASVMRNAQRLQTNQQLIRLGGKAGLPFALNMLSYQYDGVKTNEVLAGIGLKK
ncbi:MAG TPA: 5'-3' exonuclease [Candidatus Fimivicinus intestinavium]|nr:5'-3' exonuclease [Candidatus Fimivicinus intestinavium]